MGATAWTRSQCPEGTAPPIDRELLVGNPWVSRRKVGTPSPRASPALPAGRVSEIFVPTADGPLLSRGPWRLAALAGSPCRSVGDMRGRVVGLGERRRRRGAPAAGGSPSCSAGT